MRPFAVALLLPLLAGCSSLFFQPDRTLLAPPDRIGLEYEAVQLRASDGVRLAAWFLPASGAAQGSVLYLHGTAGNMSTNLADLAWLPGAGFNVLAFDYRGYGDSAGTPTLAGVQLDIDAATRWLLSRPDVDASRIIVVGQSLGAALAVYYVAHSRYRRHFRALVLDSPFCDYRQIAEEKLSEFLPNEPAKRVVDWTIPDTYSPRAAIAAVSPIPVLFIHGDKDSTVPLHHSQQLFELAGQPKQLWVVHGAGHIQALRDPVTRARLAQFLNDRVSSAQIVSGR